ncbi:MAG: hypothetical protein H6Q40_280 [Deltaproteobacteria bacterium]|nr:hypothetical protein [Deltaproteobacteria bacterium]
MARKMIVTALLFVFVIPALASAHVGRSNLVDVRIISDGGSEYPTYSAYPRLRQEGSFFYLEAVKGARYSIQVTNRSGGRIGVVIAVDGRNIISGKKSDLKRNEQMYIVGPYESNTFEGWRTGMDRTNRFYFTEASDSYAERVFAGSHFISSVLRYITVAQRSHGIHIAEVTCSQKNQAALKPHSMKTLPPQTEGSQRRKTLRSR